jgi:teichuronic acid biosynthesis glycosyltransferase TuaC
MGSLRLLIVTSEWPTEERPEWVPFLTQQVRFLRRAEVEVDVFHFRGNANPLNYLASWLRLRRNYVLQRYDLIHVHFGQAGLVALPSPLPLVVTFHGSDLQGIVNQHGAYTISGRLLQAASRRVARHTDAIILVSNHLHRYLPLDLPVHILPCGIDFDLFKPHDQMTARRQLNLPLEKTLVLFAADPANPVKRFGLAQEAVTLLKHRQEVELVVASGVPHEQMPLYMSACNTLLLTSLHEGSPTVVKEALACNLPVVSVDVGDVKERLAVAGVGLVCPSTTPEAIAEGLFKVLQDPERSDSRSRIAELDESRIVQRLLQIYRGLLASRHPNTVDPIQNHDTPTWSKIKNA